MNLQDIGFYTLSNSRCQQVSSESPMVRGEIILTGRCNFSCPYCRGLRKDCQEDMPLAIALQCMEHWCDQGLKNVRFSGGEPILYRDLDFLVSYAKARGVQRIAVSTNGSFPFSEYSRLIELGVNDFSISLDACCSAVGDKMAGVAGKFNLVRSNIRKISKLTYVSVGIVVTKDNEEQVKETIQLASDLGVADIRVIPAAQVQSNMLALNNLPTPLLEKHAILRYRISNCAAGRQVRGIELYDSHRCYLPLDDSVVCGKWHFPCVIYMREHGNPIGEIGSNMRKDRVAWSESHDSYSDPICRKNCLDVCVDHNNCCRSFQERDHFNQ